MARRCSVSTSSSPMSATTTRPARKRPGATASPTFGAWNVTVRSASTTAPATSPVDASTPEGRSTDTTGAAAALIRSMSCCSVGARLALKSGPEERIDDHVRSFDLAGLVRRVPGVTQHARRDTPVPSVRPTAADAREAARRRKRQHRSARDRGTRTLHQLRNALRIPRVALLGGAHLRSRVQRLEHLLTRKDDADRRSELPRVRHGEIDRAGAHPLRERRSAAGQAALPASADRRSRRPSR